MGHMMECFLKPMDLFHVFISLYLGVKKKEAKLNWANRLISSHSSQPIRCVTVRVARSLGASYEHEEQHQPHISACSQLLQLLKRRCPPRKACSAVCYSFNVKIMSSSDRTAAIVASTLISPSSRHCLQRTIVFCGFSEQHEAVASHFHHS